MIQSSWVLNGSGWQSPEPSANPGVWRAMVLLGVIAAHGLLAMGLPAWFGASPPRLASAVDVQGQPLSIAMLAQARPVNDSHRRVRAAATQATATQATAMTTTSAKSALTHSAAKPNRIATASARVKSAPHRRVAPASRAMPASNTMAATQMLSAQAAINSAQGAAAAPPQSRARFDADYLHNPTPVYPAFSLRLREEGRVLLRVWVTAQGGAKQVMMAHSSGYARLDEAALAAVRQWRFVPARAGEEPMDSWVLVPVQFSLRGEA